jgi:TatD DNase family protein
MRWTDNHCHLPPGPAGDAQVAEALAAGVTRLIDVGTDVARSRQAIANAARHPGVVFATVGVHPHDAKDGMDGLADLLSAPGVVAIGECGLDYHYDHSPRPAQQEIFARQIALAHAHDLPLVIHTRSAWDDTFEVLDREGTPERTVFHCFTGGPDEAAACVARGAYLSFSGIVTFPTSDDLRAAARRCPPERVLVETDSPYLAPVPRRGKKNVPANVVFVGAAMAAELGTDTATVAALTWDNATRAYALEAS